MKEELKLALRWYVKQGIQEMNTVQVEGMGVGRVKKILFNLTWGVLQEIQEKSGIKYRGLGQKYRMAYWCQFELSESTSIEMCHLTFDTYYDMKKEVF